MSAARATLLDRGFYLSMSLLIAAIVAYGFSLGVLRDLVVERRVHPVYRYALPALVAGQIVVTCTVVRRLEYWRGIGHAMLR